MHFDRTHRPWALATAAVLALATLGYIPYALRSPNGASGGSAVGLIYGVAGFGLMIFAALLSLRKKFPIWRIGRSQTWMRGHIWLGLLSYPLILFHAGFSFGGSLTRVMMWMFTLVIVSGVLGALLQHYMPRVMTERVPLETIYYQIDRVQGQLLEEADQLLKSLAHDNNEYGVLVPAAGGSQTATTTLIRLSDRSATEVRNVYDHTIRTYLAERGAYSHALADRRTSKETFAKLRTMTPESIHSMVDDLENICEEKRDLDRQSRLHRILHGWLLAHVPLSFALIVLGAVHAIIALRY